MFQIVLSRHYDERSIFVFVDLSLHFAKDLGFDIACGSAKRTLHGPEPFAVGAMCALLKSKFPLRLFKISNMLTKKTTSFILSKHLNSIRGRPTTTKSSATTRLTDGKTP